MDEFTNVNLHRLQLVYMAKRQARRQTRSDGPVQDQALGWRLEEWLHRNSKTLPRRGFKVEPGTRVFSDLGTRFAGADLAEPVELPQRLRDAGSNRRFELYGYGAVWFDGSEPTQYRMGGNVVERFARGAFTESLRSRTQKAFWSHNITFPIGSIAGGSLTLREDSRGLAYTVEPPASAVSDYFCESVTRGDTDGASIGFILDDDGVDFDVSPDGVDLIATVRQCDLIEVSPTAIPAYAGTSCSARVIEERSDFDDWQDQCRYFNDADIDDDEDGADYMARMSRWCAVELGKTNRAIAASKAPLPTWLRW